MKDFIHNHIVDEFLEDNEALDNLNNKLENEFHQLKKDRHDLRSFIFTSGEDKIALPVNIPRLLANAKEAFKLNRKEKTDLEPSYVLDCTK